MRRIFTIVALFALCAASPPPPRRLAPDFIVHNARIYTVDPAMPQAQALAMRDGRIIAVGSNATIMALARPATGIIDAYGKTIVPGLIDAHMHLEAVGQQARTLGVFGTTSYNDLLSVVSRQLPHYKRGAWVVGRGWDQNHWPGQAFPMHEPLDAISNGHPIILTRVDGHAVLANALAMQQAGITAATPDPPGGKLLRDASGAPTGVFVDNAQALIRRAVPAPTDKEIKADIRAAISDCVAAGITAIANPGINRHTVELEESVAKAKRFTIREYIMVSGDEDDVAWALARGPVSAAYNGHLWIRAIKLYADGALGSRGAALLAPYSDDPNATGLLVTDPKRIESVAERALRGGFQIATHAIGDRGNRIVLDAYQAAFTAVPTTDPRFRIEHAQVVAPSDIPRFAALHVIPSMQSSHQTSDMGWVEQRVGPERIKGAYAWRSFLKTGVHIANGTDAPVEHIDPMITFHSAVTRQDASNQPPGGWYPDQRMTRMEALKSMTIWAAEANFQEKLIGSITPGKYADFVILSQDIMTVAPEKILDTYAMATYIGGRVVAARKSKDLHSSPAPRASR